MKTATISTSRSRTHFGLLLLWLCTAFLASACAKKMAPAARPSGMPAPPPLRQPQSPPAPQSAPADLVLGKTKRILIYRAELSLTVLEVNRALSTAQRAAEEMGGYLQSIDDTSIQLRIPAARFEEALARLTGLGEVTSRHISAQDITEEMLDLEIRLDTAREMRQRLLAILERSERVEDALAVEKELGRVVTEIERMEGKIRLLKEQVDFSTILLRLNPLVTAERERHLVPFPWIQQLAGRIDQRKLSPGRVRDRPPIDLPSGFVRFEQTRHSMWATSADGVILSYRVYDNPDGAPLDYWQEVATTYLTEVRHILIQGEPTRVSAGGTAAIVLHGARGTDTGYSLALVTTDRHIYVTELYGEPAAMGEKREQLEHWVTGYRTR